jgi:ribA/ribD-fused uncharacterized protein
MKSPVIVLPQSSNSSVAEFYLSFDSRRVGSYGNSRPAIKGFGGDHFFLSNFYPKAISHKGRRFHTSEHAYVWEKCPTDLWYAAVSSTKSPGKVKAMGRSVKLRPNWEEIKVQAMYDVVKSKFADSFLEANLLGTGSAYLEETNMHKDSYWGVYKEQGENVLGYILMVVRQEIVVKL